jgi:hypothetical protein
VESQGTPVETAGLMSDLGLERTQVQALAEQAMRALADEWKDIGLACCKVRSVH